MSGYVYFLFNPKTNLTKIGQSTDPLLRKKRLEAEHGPLEGLGVVRTHNPTKLEQSLHALLDAKRIEKEWFRLDKSLEGIRLVLVDKLLSWSEFASVEPTMSVTFQPTGKQRKYSFRCLGPEPPKRLKVSTSLRSDLLETLDAMAERQDTSRSSLIEQAVAAWVVGRE